MIVDTFEVCPHSRQYKKHLMKRSSYKLLNEIECDIENYQGQSLCYVDNTNRGLVRYKSTNSEKF